MMGFWRQDVEGCSSKKAKDAVKVTGTGVYIDAHEPEKSCSRCFCPEEGYL